MNKIIILCLVIFIVPSILAWKYRAGTEPHMQTVSNMTIRQFVAVQILSTACDHTNSPKEAAKKALEMADALLEEELKTRKEDEEK